MKKSAKYNIIVFSDQHAEHRQFAISKKAVMLFFAGVMAGSVALVVMGLTLTKKFYRQSVISELKEENQALRLANDRYLEASIEMERKLKLFDEKTTKLAQFVGVEPSGLAVDGIGGPDIFENELNQYLRYDLGLLQDKTELLEERFDALEEAFVTQTELLDATPSILPARGWISSGFQYRTDPFTKKRTWHNGIDISAPEGTPIYAPADGVITYRGYQGGFGNLLAISHGSGLKTRFGHLKKFNVSKGQRVRRGDLIGYVGSTGRSTAPHLHYEVHQEDRAINPMKYIIREAKTF